MCLTEDFKNDPKHQKLYWEMDFLEILYGELSYIWLLID